ncbi:uncharacterized protein LOC132256049 [Phlebotomus argentipes]|uniref:uncharacterized protein LOC132256049 n=1 Tax=Phlebotomus argentipes TaxID=94469 RepID=UPI0028930AE2|nr:uncharacterized protein LOC132256049 [Phlebotomus argentipes]
MLLAGVTEDNCFACDSSQGSYQGVPFEHESQSGQDVMTVLSEKRSRRLTCDSASVWACKVITRLTAQGRQSSSAIDSRRSSFVPNFARAGLTMDLLALMQPLGILAASFVGFIVIFKRRSQKHRMGHYTLPEWNFFLKQRWAEKIIRRRLQEEDPGENFFSVHPDDQVHTLERDGSVESLQFYGTDSQGNELLVRISRRKSRAADVVMCLRLESGEIFTLPQHPDTRIPTGNIEEAFEVAGLQFQCLDANSRWRIVFAGYLRRGIRQEWSTTVKDDELVFVRLNFIWGAASEPFAWPWSWSPKLMASALATEPWLDGRWSNMLPLSVQGVDQFGSLLGQISIAEGPIIELNLPGSREKRWGIERTDNLHRSATFWISCHDGLVFTLNTISFSDGLTHVQSGNVRVPCGDVYAIDWSDFHLSSLAEHPKSLPRALTFRFSSEGRNFTAVLHFHLDQILPLQGGRPLEWFSRLVSFQATVNGIPGRGSVCLFYPESFMEVNLPYPVEEGRCRRLRYKDIKPGRRLVVKLTDTDAQSVAVAGGKGASLALLTCAAENGNFTVPGGFIVTSAAYKLQMHTNQEVQSLLEIIENICGGEIEGDLKESCSKVTEMISNLTLREEILKDINDSLSEATGSDSDDNTGDFEVVREIRYAVRSSGISEDGSDASAAGQNETFLGLSSAEEILKAIVKCWASLYTFQSVQYRRQNTQPIITEMAVVVQQMVSADVAGVLFSRHPSTGNPSHVLITANYGLGESVVSGEVDPDVFVVKRNFHDTEFRLIETSIGKKEYKIRMAPNGKDVEKVPLDEDVQKSTCLSEKLIVKITEIGVRLEQLYGNPRDIEWATFDGKIYLLQSRPITSLDAFTDWELAHEYDYAVMSPEDARSTANVQEVFPGCTAPLSLLVVAKLIDEATFQQYTGFKSSKLLFNVFWLATYQLGFEVYNLILRQPEEKMQAMQKVFDLAIMGKEFMTEEVLKIGIHRRGIVSKWEKTKLLTQLLSQILNNGSRSKRGVVVAKSFKNEYSPESLERFSTAAELYEDIKGNYDCFKKMAEIHGAVSQVSVMSQLVLIMVMMEGTNDLTDEHLNDLALLLRCSKEVESAEIPKNLAEIGRKILASGQAEEFSKLNPKEGVTFLETNCREAHKLFTDFITKNHHRALKEFDLATETWGMRPDIVIGMLQANVKFGKAPATASAEDNEDIVDQLRTPKRKLTKTILRRLVSLLKKSVQRRELSKSNLIAVVHEFRMAYRHMGRLMVAEGRLSEAQLIFYLVPAEIDRLLKHRDARLVHKASRRRRLMAQWEDIKFPDIQTGLPRSLNSSVSIPEDSGECIVQGTTVCPGLITARACVLKSFAGVDQIEPGDILITYSTDIGWSPYFPMLGAVVTELGGLISHGAVVAREYGLPCIVAANGATDYFKTGDRVTLDAGRGVIFRTELHS